MCAQVDERAALFGAAVEHSDIMSSLQQILRHRRSHASQSDESNFHVETSSLFPVTKDLCSGAMNSGPIGSVIVAFRMRSIFARLAASRDQPATPSVGRS